MSDSPTPPPAPDYLGAAKEKSQGDLAALQAQTAANRLNQTTPYGNLKYAITGKDQNGNDVWSSTQTLAPQQQALLDQQNKTSIGLSGLADRGLGYVDTALSNNITANDLPANSVNPGQTGQDALMSRFQPMIDQSNKALDNTLANQGIMQGSEAYNNAWRPQNQSSNDMRMQAALNGINVGQNAQSHQLGIKTALQNQPLNMLNAVRTGSQVTNPTFGSSPQQGATSGPDFMGALQGKAQYGQGLYNSQVAQNNSNTNAAVGIGTAALAAFF